MFYFCIDTGYTSSSSLTNHSNIKHEHLNSSSVLNETLVNKSQTDVDKNGTESPPLNELLHNELVSCKECSHESSMQNGHEPMLNEKENELVGETCPLEQNEHESRKGKALSVSTETESSDMSKKDDDDKKEEFATFSLKLILPSVPEPIEIVVSIVVIVSLSFGLSLTHTHSLSLQHIAKDTVNELLQYAFERPETCYRTCLSIRMNGKRLDNFAELGSIKGLKNKSILELAEGEFIDSYMYPFSIAFIHFDYPFISLFIHFRALFSA